MTSVQDLNKSRAEALRALVSSLSHRANEEPQRLSPEQVNELSQTLDQILGDTDPGSAQKRNERGELVNEDGLPIIDVTEPVEDQGSAQLSVPMEDITEYDPAPLSALSADEREKRRFQRERILDLLEAEEEEQTERDAERGRQEALEALQKRKETARQEIARLTAAKDMQRKMGKALINDVSKADEAVGVRSTGDSRTPKIQDGSEASSTAAPRKTVAFADADGNRVDNSPKIIPAELGDISLASLRNSTRRSLLNKAVMDKFPMRMDVVERVPGAAPDSKPETQRDSDDESDPDSPQVSDDDKAQCFVDGGNEAEADDDDDDDDEGESDGIDLGDDFDISTAQHQREVALEYYRMRGTIGAEAAKAMVSHSHDEGEDEWDRPEVPLEATLSAPPPKPPASRFKAARKFAYNVPPPRASTSLGAAVLPAGQSRNIQKAIRTGKLVDGKLVGGDDGDSASDGNEDRLREQEMLELLKNGDIMNIGPKAPGGGLNIASSTVTERSIPTIVEHSTTVKQPSSSNPGLRSVSAPSRFKVARGTIPSSGEASQQPLARDRPNLRSSGVSPVSPPERTKNIRQPPLPFKKPPTVISAPSTTRSDPEAANMRALESAVINSPSFTPSVIIASPSFPQPGGWRPNAPTPGDVSESNPSPSGPPPPQGKVSRFKAERQ